MMMTAITGKGTDYKVVYFDYDKFNIKPEFSAGIKENAKRLVTTAVLVDSGQTVVIGGVYEFKSQEDLNKVPFLGDLPGLGNLFRIKNKSSSKAEMLIFVTPKILQVKQRN